MVVPKKTNIQGLLAYEGTRFLGWQRTQMGPSIQEELEKSLSIILNREIRVEAASRTDAGVHARGQVINFFLEQSEDLHRLKRSMNALLPREIVITDLKEVDSSFHPTLHAKGKEYHYDVVSGSVQSPFIRAFSWHVPYELNPAQMQVAANELIGEYDFSAFCNERTLLDIDPICHLFDLGIEKIKHGHFRIRAFGNRFLYRMVRNLAGTLVYVGCNKLRADSMKKLLQGKQRSFAGMTAPAQGLFLNRVYYDFA